MADHKLITKEDEYGNLWVLVGEQKKTRPNVASKSLCLENIDKKISEAINGGLIPSGMQTASSVAQAAGLNMKSKPVINAVAKTLRVMGFHSKRVSSGRFFIIG